MNGTVQLGSLQDKPEDNPEHEKGGNDLYDRIWFAVLIPDVQENDRQNDGDGPRQEDCERHAQIPARTRRTSNVSGTSVGNVTDPP